MEALVNFKGEPQELNLPSAPKQYIQYLEEDDRPQVKLDVDYEMVWASASDVSARIRSMTEVHRFGSQYGPRRSRRRSALCELLTAKGYIQKK